MTDKIMPKQQVQRLMDAADKRHWNIGEPYVLYSGEVCYKPFAGIRYSNDNHMEDHEDWGYSEGDAQLIANAMNISASHQALHEEVDRLEKLYGELLMTVANKFPDESRHETALRYIKQSEQNRNGPECTTPQGEKDE